MNNMNEVSGALKIFEMQESELNIGDDKRPLQLKVERKYKRLALKKHPDKGGTTAAFQELQNAYLVLQKLWEPDANNSEPDANNKNGDVSVKTYRSKSVVSAGIELSVILREVEEALLNYPKNIPSEQLKHIFKRIEKFILFTIEIKDSEVKSYDPTTLLDQAETFKTEINKIYRGPSPLLAGMVAGIFLTLILGVAVLMFALNSLGGLTGATTLACVIAIPLVSGLTFGTICFFAASNAQKNRTEQQGHMQKIIEALNALANALKESPPEELERTQQEEVAEIEDSNSTTDEKRPINF